MVFPTIVNLFVYLQPLYVPLPLMNLGLFYSLSFSVLISLSDESPFYEQSEVDCAPANCGDVRNITYPFWEENQQRSYCGFPSFKLTCENRTLILTTTFLSLQVKNIFYGNRSVLVVDKTFAGLPLKCGFTQRSVDSPLDLTLLDISGVNRKLVFLYNCSKPPSDNYYKINCTSGVHTAYAVLGTDLSYPVMCSGVDTFVAGYMGDDIHHYFEAVNYGFLLDWSATDCEECIESNGQCGYNETYSGFMCICPDQTHYKSCPSDYHPRKKRSLGPAVILAVAGIGGVSLLGTCVVLFLRIHRKRNITKRRKSSSSGNPGTSTATKTEETCYNTHIFSYEELEEATHGFHESRKLGKGGFGTVYKGILRDGRIVAVKRLHENNCRLEQFMNEVEILSCVRHQNLVTLYGCTTHHSHELLLVYEYIPNGTLADHLHGSLTTEGGLPWPTRMSIIIQIAQALAYLHSVEPQIIHRDIKTDNILLDHNFQVKVADFGISRLFPLDATHISTAPQGTFGYLDPTYYRSFRLTDKSDVYSFGVVLIELISSKPAVDFTRHSDEISLANMAIAKIQNCRIGELVDLDLGYGSDLDITEMIDKVAWLAFRCLLPDLEMRPGLKEVVGVLKRIKGEVDVDGVGSSVKEESNLLSNDVLFSSDYVTGR